MIAVQPRRILLACLALAALAGAERPAVAPLSVDEALAAFWVAETDEDFAQSIDAILATNPVVEELWTKLREGRPYSAQVPLGRQLLSRRNRDGVEHGYVLHVPESYAPGTPYPVRVYLHGGVSRPKRTDGDWWRNDVSLARDDAIRVFPASWDESLWWQRSQIENLTGLLNDIKRLYNVDENRVHLLGVSDGGTGAYYHAFKATTPWAGFLPFIGHPVVLANAATDVDGDMHVTNLRSKPFFVVSGALDRRYPARSVELYVRMFRAAGVDVEFRPQADGGHDMRWWPSEAARIDSFIRDTPRIPLPDRLTWETESTEEFNRAHWLVIDDLGAVDGESDLAEVNTLTSRVERPALGFNVLGVLQNRPGLRILEVRPGSMAASSGVAVDDIILDIDGISTPAIEAFREAILGFAPGHELPMTVERAGVVVELMLTYPVDRPVNARPAFPRRAPSGRVDIERLGNTVTVSTRGVRGYTLLLSREQFDFSRPIRVVMNDIVAHDAVVTPDARTLLRWAARDQDRSLLFGAELEIEVR